MEWNIFVVVIFICVVSGINGQGTCTKTTTCTCSMSDGSGDIDLNSLTGSGGAAFADSYAADGYFYSYNPCAGFSEGSCTGVAACQIAGDQSAQYTVGDVSSEDFTFDGTSNHVQYTHTDDTGFQRYFDVTLVCDQNADPPTFIPNGEASPGSGQYSATLTTKCACPGVCANAPPPSPTPGPKPHNGVDVEVTGGLTTGSWICIVFFSLAFVYIIGGVIIQKSVRKANGKDVIPNSSFWLALPSLIKEGFQFTISKVCRRSGYERK